MHDPKVLTHARFAELLQTTFRIHLDSAMEVEVELVEVSSPKESSRQEWFSVIFRGPLDYGLPQSNYNMEHETLGAFELFLVPVETGEAGFLYQAVFNRLKKPN